MLDNGYWVTIGETYGASQGGGSVASHVRISKKTQYGPLGVSTIRKQKRAYQNYGSNKTSVARVDQEGDNGILVSKDWKTDRDSDFRI
jgi:hypothetical protein